MAEVCHTGDMFSGKAWVGSIRTGDFGRRLCYSDGKGLQGTAAVCSGFFCFWHISCVSISVKTLQNRRHGFLETKDYSGYSIFEGISGDNLKTITDSRIFVTLLFTDFVDFEL